LLGRQLAGVSSEMVKQMTSRLFKTHKGVKGLVLQVEPKEEYKKRMGESPDETDASFILLEGARERHFFVPEYHPRDSQLRSVLCVSWCAVGVSHPHGVSHTR